MRGMEKSKCWRNRRFFIVAKFNIGNVKMEKIMDMWNNEKAKKFRNHILGGKLPICNHCAGFYL